MKFNKQLNKLKINILTTTILSFISLHGFSQIFDSEQNPLSVKWRQISRNGFRLIYPSELEKEAQRMANTIPFIYPYVGRDLDRQKTSIPIVFQNRGIIANGFVQLAPKKSQFNTTPPQQFDSQDWLNNLAVHELRHVAQFDKITGGQAHPFPEEIYFAYLGASIPTWFFEGDAVSTETSLTHAGRGRQPSWIMPFRTSLLNGQNFSYSKAYFGSNKDQTPGYYQLGYLLTSQLRQEFGKGIIDSLLADIHRRPLRLYPFSQSLKKFTGYNTKKFYTHVLAQLKNDWQKQNEQTQSIEYQSLNRPSKIATNYYLPTALPNGQLLTLKQGKDEVAGFVVLNPDKSEEKLFRIGYQEQPWFSYANQLLVWDEVRYDPRYKQRNYSVICLYDFSTKTRRQLTFKTRLFSPTLSGDGKKLLAVRADLSNNFNLVAIDLGTGNITKTYSNPDNLILQTPALSADGSQVSWVGVSEKGKSLWLAKESGETQKLIEETNQQLSRPIFIGDKIAFNAHLSGLDNIYEVTPADKKIVALTSAKYGAFNPSPSNDGRSIFFNHYQLMGYEVATAPIEPKEVTPDHFVYFGEAAEKQENTGDVFRQIPDSTYRATPYSPLAHAFSFHSISPTVDDDDRVGIALKSNDLLNTVDFFGGLSYHSDLRKLEYNAGLTYKSLYPILSATFRNRPRLAYYRLGGQIHEANWRENRLELKASVPLSVNVYNHNYSFLGELGTSYTQRNFAPQEAAIFNRTLNFPMSYRLGLGHSVRMAERNVAPKWAQSVTFTYYNQPFDRHLNGDLIAFESAFYFPGLMRNHAFMASFNYQQSSGVLKGNNEIATVYGYGQIRAKSELKNTLLLNYRFPIAFPDAEIGPFAYIRNLRGGFFSHYENIGTETNLAQPKTFGLELRSSLNLLRYQPVIDLGIRTVFVNKVYNQNPILEFIFNYSF